MRAYVELPVFLALAAGLHIAVVLPGRLEGVTSGGVGGDALLSIQGSTASIAAMVQRWEEVPEVTPELEMAEAPPPDVVPDQPEFEPVEALSLKARLDDAPPLPMIQREEPVPMAEAPPKPMTPEAMAVESSPRPQPRPEQAAPPDTPPSPTRPESPRPTPAPEAPSRPEPTEAAPPPPAPEPVPEPPRETRRNAAPSVAVAPTRAAGQGGGAAAGSSGNAEVATLSQAQRQSLLQTWGAKIRARVARRAPRGRWKGQALVQITVSASGQLMGVSLVRSSGNAELDQAALDAVRRAGRFPKAPAKLGISQHSFNLPVTAR
ncbi:TonB family protein [Aliiroseovarius sp.]|uniref:TonB family protein n=1 Tax=Aliiroseovarius sp. TaxID=1872442 RepID=UPI003BAC6AC4